MPTSGPSSANPERLYAGINKEDPEWIRFVNPGDLRVAAVTWRQVPSRRGAQGAQEHDGARAPCSGALRSTTTASCRTRTRGTARPTRPDGIAASPPDDRSATVVDPAKRRGNCRYSRSAAAVRDRTTEQHPARLRARRPLPARRSFPGPAQPAPAPRASPTRASVRSRPRHAKPHRSRLAQPAENAPARPAPVPCSARTTTRATSGPRVAPRATSSTPTTATPRTARHVRAVRQPAGTRSATDPTIPKEERGHPIRHDVHAFGDSVEPVHRVPHPSRHDGDEHVPRDAVVGQRNRREALLPAGRSGTRPRRSGSTRSRRSNPEEAGGARPVVRLRVPEERAAELNDELENVQIADFHGHGWLFRNVYKRDLSPATCSTSTATVIHRRATPTSSRNRST